MIAGVRWLVGLSSLPISLTVFLLAVWFAFLFLPPIHFLPILPPMKRCYRGGVDLGERIPLGVATGAGATE